MVQAPTSCPLRFEIQPFGIQQVTNSGPNQAFVAHILKLEGTDPVYFW